MALEADSPVRVAYFITPHGFGHTTRACAIMSAMHRLDARLHFDVYSDVGEALLHDSMGAIFTLHKMATDVGLVQLTAMCEDLEASAERLDAFYPLSERLVTEVATRVSGSGACAVLCDIAPLGILAARQAGLPSVLIENFTWDWIYAGYAERAPDIARHAPYLREVFSQATHHIKTAPACSLDEGVRVFPPVSRCARQAREVTRAALGIGDDEHMIMFTLGMREAELVAASWLAEFDRVRLVVPAPSADAPTHPRLTCVPFHGGPYFPDLIYASDSVVGKLGYSTVAEVYQSGVPFAYLARSTFRESGPLADFVQREMPNVFLGYDVLREERWWEALARLLSLRPAIRPQLNGADGIAETLCNQLLRH